MRYRKFWFILLILVQVLGVPCRKRSRTCRNRDRLPGEEQCFSGTDESPTVRILRGRGYNAGEYFVQVQDKSYTLSLIRATNPLINNGKAGLPGKDPLLFIHGLGGNANEYIMINNGVRSHDYSGYSFSSMSEDEIYNKIKEDPGSKSLVFTALNFGYEVWMLHRRSTRDSRKAHKKYGSRLYSYSEDLYLDVDSDYWNYSFDEQAKYDIPTVVDFILSYTNKTKVAMIGHSAGSTLILMTLAEVPEMANKISKVIHWGLAFDFRDGITQTGLDVLAKYLVDSICVLSGPILPQYFGYIFGLTEERIESLVPLWCSEPFGRYFCEKTMDAFQGEGSHQLLIQNVRPSNYWMHTGSLHEGCQYVQSLKKTRMHYFDFLDSETNMRKYGQPEPPLYNISRIKLKTMSFWHANNDKLSRMTNFKIMQERLKVPIREFHVGGNGIEFNHLGFILHRNTDRLVVVPNMRFLEERDEKPSAHEIKSNHRIGCKNKHNKQHILSHY